MSQDQHRKTFDEGNPHWLDEPCKGSLSAQDVVRLLDTQTFFELLGMPYPPDREGVIERLERESLIDRAKDGYSIRRIGALLLAKRFEDFPFEIGAKAPRVVVYSGNSEITAKLDRIQSEGYAVGFERLMHLVMHQIPQREVIENALRRKIELVPDIPVREMVANALIHQDFTLTGMRVTIEIYADRIEISSPGEPLVPLDRSIDRHRSRNQRLVSIPPP
ncbi:ATP-binding protein [Thioalkalivibrio sp. HK1]|uniref:ATP-binding protein n=1 Tax=Thioalkalivibrio sp. HK1 TaxID=1469245 RepID=UPI0018CC1868|nr:ATP-binding protein [Thioalkalivibrio sp. HK1]